ncbi:hypothetical protein [Leifsonia sp. Leaf264]|uniref:hypothetical protein n=1 Tax=Leifsonia sp. Leaf264 TaxID=1736314 RepID=UPI0006F8E4AD|nr:hypothetical protein [Leifsonia sp. Leaf264]KQO95405.1 hypothetical protein ASF30_20525 [Leifsonia sp. Leaf264]
MKKKLVAIALAVVAFVAIPVTAATAAEYNGQGSSATTTAGNSAELSFSGLDANAPVTIQGDGVTLAVVKAGSIAKTTDASGSVSTTATASAPGTYTVTATTANAVAVATFTVLPADSSSADGLASTGANVPMLLIWGAAGAILLGIALVVVLTTVRRNRAAA